MEKTWVKNSITEEKLYGMPPCKHLLSPVVLNRNDIEMSINKEKVTFWLGGVPITNARNIEWRDNLDGSSQLWFDAVFEDEDGVIHVMRFHIPKIRMDSLSQMSMADHNGILWEVTDITNNEDSIE